MRRQSPLPFAVIAAVFVLLTGCKPQEPFYFHEDSSLSHYKGVATEIEYPAVDSTPLADVTGAIEPFSLSNKSRKEMWDLKLEEAIETALRNNKIIRSVGGQVNQQTVDIILRNPDAVQSIYDPAIVETNPRFGTEAALSAFDTQFSTNLFWQKLDTPQNTTSPFQYQILQGDNANFVAQLQKVNAAGGTTSVRHNVQYSMSNQPYRLYPSDWNANLEIEARQPLLRGAGVQVNRINGPGAQPGAYNGIMLARINTDIALADFEAAVRNLVSETESAYWDLYMYYRWLDASNKGFESATQTWQKVKALSEVGQKGGEAYSLSQAQEQYYLFRSIAKQTLGTLYEMESKLRYWMGIAPTDGRLIRPIDEPTTAKVAFDFYEVQNEAQVRNVELRRIKWAVKARDLELIGAKNFLLPQLDVDALYRWRGLGNDLLSSSRQAGDFRTAGSNAYQSLTSGDYQEWQAGLIFQMPIGFRRELSGVRNAQLRLTKEHVKLQEAELELTHLLQSAFRSMNNDYELSRDNFNRLLAAQRDVDSVDAAFTAGQIGIDVLLQAQRLVAQAERDYYQNVVNYNKDIMMVHFRKGSLLEYNGVYLAEGPWPGKAYFDARRRARARDAALYLDYGFTQPRVISEGPYEQNSSKSLFGGSDEVLPGDENSLPETVPTPAPELNDSENHRKEAKPIPAPQPEPDTTTALPHGKARNLSQNATIASGEGRATKIKSAKPSARKTFDIGSLQLDELEDRPVRQASATKAKSSGGKAADDGVRSAEYREPSVHSSSSTEGKAAMKSSNLQWIDAQQDDADESDANPPAAESDRAAAGWKRVQR